MPSLPYMIPILNEVVREFLPGLMFEQRFGGGRGARNTDI